MPKSTRAEMEKARDIVLARDGTTCQCCGVDVTHKLASLQHRIPRGAGGSARVNTPSNLVLVCGSATTPGSCHNWMEHEDRTAAEVTGWLLPKCNQDIDTTREPIYTKPHGWVLLDNHGNRTACDPPEEVVA